MPATNVTTTSPCVHCPDAPEGTADLLANAVGLAYVPLIGLVCGLLIVVGIRDWTAGPSRGYFVLASVLVVSLIATGHMYVPIIRTGGVVAGVAVAAMAAVCRVRPASGDPGVGDRLGVWLAGATLWTCALVLARGSLPDMLAVLAGLAALFPLSYPFGLALGQRAEIDFVRVIAVATAMGATVVAGVAHLVPFPGGTAYILLLPFAPLIVVILLLGVPLVALGEARAVTTSPTDRGRSESTENS